MLNKYNCGSDAIKTAIIAQLNDRKNHLIIIFAKKS